MRKYLFVFVSLGLLAASFFVLRNSNQQKNQLVENEVLQEKLPKEQRIAQALEWRMSKLLNDETGVFNVADYYAAINRANELKGNAAKKASLGLTWSLIGPDNQGGRTRALLFDNQVPNKLWAGSVGGGLFSSLDGGNNWTRVETYDGFFPIASIAQASNGDLYVGTGEGLGNPIVGSSYSSQSPGNGIYKSTDGGDSWYLLIGTDAGNDPSVVSGSCSWCAVNDIAISPTNPNLILVATQGGLRVSTIGGEDVGAWTLASGISGSLEGQSVEISSDGQTAFAAFGGRVFRSADFANNFTSGWVSTSVVSGQRADIAIAPSNEDYVYASVSASNSCLQALWRSTDKGLTWDIIVNGGTPYVSDPFNQPTSAIGVCAGQGWYDQTIAVNPADENKIYVGGITLFTWGDGYGFKRADKIDTQGGGPFDSDYIHADKHEIIFSPLDLTGNTMLVGSDGGVTLCNNANTGFPDNLNFIQKNKGYATLQVYGMGAGAAGEVLSGNQDNGSQYIDGLGSSVFAATEISGGDGVYAEISNLVPDVMFAGVYNGQINRSINRGLSTNAFIDENIGRGCSSIRCTPVTSASPCDPQGGDAPFIYPFYLMETSTVGTPQQTAFIEARNDTLLLASGATQIVFDTLYQSYKVRTTITIKDGNSVQESEITNVSSAGYEYTSAVSDDVTFFSNLVAPVLYPGEKEFIDDPYDARYFVTSNCGLWMCINPLQKTQSPIFYKISGAPGGIGGMDASKDGDVLYVTSGANLVIIQGFNALNASLAAGGCLSNTCTSGLLNIRTVSLGFTGTARLEGVAVDKNNPNNVLVVKNGFGNSNKVWRVENALSPSPNVVALHGSSLPSMPLYDCIIDYNNSNRYILGTELGIWTSDDAGLTWSEDNDGMFGRMPVYRVRQEWMYDTECMVLYAGTHGGGMFRTTSLTAGGCDLTPYQWNKIDGPATGIRDISKAELSNIKLFPNPVQDNASVHFDLSASTSISMKIVDVTGKVVSSQSFGKRNPGSQILNFNASNLSPGNYFVAIHANGKLIGSKQFVKK